MIAGWCFQTCEVVQGRIQDLHLVGGGGGVGEGLQRLCALMHILSAKRQVPYTLCTTGVQGRLRALEARGF